MNHILPVPAVPVEDFDALYGTPGAFSITDAGDAILFTCPCGCDDRFRLPVYPAAGALPTQGKGWAWDGHRQAPTLAPSIRQMAGCKWHGHLQAGLFIPCGDSGR